MSSYSKMESFFFRLHQIDHALAILGWDEAVMMPHGSGDSRAHALSELKVIRHEILMSNELLDLVQQLELQSEKSDKLSLWQKANLFEAKRMLTNARAVKSDLVKSISFASAKCEQTWRTLRGENNWNDFLPLISEVINLSREEADQRSEALGLSPYDCLLDLFSPGINESEISKVFTQVKSFLPDLIHKITERQKSINIIPPPDSIPIENQRTLGLDTMKILGFNFNKGRLDVSHHPFCGGVPEDVRITTRYSKSHFMESLEGIIHETGHALYDQNLPREFLTQPVGMARGMDIHESQSLLFEKYFGRNKSFIKFLIPFIKQHLSTEESSPFWNVENVLNYLNHVNPSLIRVNADEVTYPIHIILRFEIERDLIHKKIETQDIPEIWDMQMKKYLGINTKGNYKDGCMQDVHWPSGAFGYFPSYTLGSLIAAQIYSKIKIDLTQLDFDLQSGNLESIHEWLRTRIWSKGSLLSSSDLIRNATGEYLNPNFFKKYIEEKYLG